MPYINTANELFKFTPKKQQKITVNISLSTDKVKNIVASN
ncbi:hypothetical protein Xenpb_01829 [Xenorhabdus sp. PB62.4]|nr:hypothetical protein [Xenorhabdus sp. PB62.4]